MIHPKTHGAGLLLLRGCGRKLHVAVHSYTANASFPHLWTSARTSCSVASKSHIRSIHSIDPLSSANASSFMLASDPADIANSNNTEPISCSLAFTRTKLSLYSIRCHSTIPSDIHFHWRLSPHTWLKAFPRSRFIRNQRLILLHLCEVWLTWCGRTCWWKIFLLPRKRPRPTEDL